MRTVILVFVGAMLLAGACEGSRVVEAPISDPPGMADPKEPCALLSPAGVEAAIGTPVRSEREVDSHDPVTRICSYKTTEPWASVAVVVEKGVTQDEFDKRAQRDAINTEIVREVGDAAFIHGCAGIQVLAGDVAVGLSIQHLTTCEETAVVLEALGRETVEQLSS